ncbi:MAG: DUF1553 domain-containing protein [Planctomycetales bacterium]|nr:DUF1553 domain-containing protein [Planctomycetales bacterium]
MSLRFVARCTALLIGVVLLVCSPLAFAGDAATLLVTPDAVQLAGNFSQTQLVVNRADEAGQPSADLTHEASFTSSDPHVVAVDQRGRLLARANGEATIHVEVAGQSRDVAVHVEGVQDVPAIRFTHHIRPILNKSGCAAAACHASQHGKGGFKLSVRGYDPPADYEAITRAGFGRRVDLARPEHSLILRKPSHQLPHGGGQALPVGSVDYQILAAWLAAGAAPPEADEPEVTELVVFPLEYRGSEGQRLQLRVEAVYDDGQRRDVTAWANFDTLDEAVAVVNGDGQVSLAGRGQAAVMVRFEGETAVSTLVVPYRDAPSLEDWQPRNFIDELAADKFRELGIEPSGLCDDATFLRRAFLDSIGSLPTIEESRAFLADADPQKRERLIDRLLGLSDGEASGLYNDRYAAFWTLRWSDLIGNTSDRLGDQGMWALHNWLKQSLRENRRFDEIVGELVTAKGSIYSQGPANYFRIYTNSEGLAEATAQVFLGIRMECAKCHHHPFEKYSQADYYGLAAFFSRVGTKNSEEFGLFGREQVVLVRNSGDVRHPRTGQIVPPTPLDGEPTDDLLDRRLPLADWLTSPENKFFATNLVNRYVAFLLGRGLVEPVDDLRSTNPPTNAPLLDALAEDFVAHDFDLKQLIRTIMNSRLYQLDWRPTENNAADEKYYSHFHVKRLAAEPLLDAIDQVTEAPTKFPNLPLGTRAIELPDAEYAIPFLNTFGKPRRVSVCECERSREANLAQAMHTLNGSTVADKIAKADGRLAKLLGAKAEHDQIVETLYLAALARMPSEAELAASREFLDAAPDAKQCYEDLLWALINSKEFVFVH